MPPINRPSDPKIAARKDLENFFVNEPSTSEGVDTEDLRKKWTETYDREIKKYFELVSDREKAEEKLARSQEKLNNSEEVLRYCIVGILYIMSSATLLMMGRGVINLDSSPKFEL